MSSIKKIVVIGPESTGKSTLSSALSSVLATKWVPEFARDYLTKLERPYNEADLWEIAQGQLQSEDKAERKADKYLICDTDLYVIKVWAEAKYGNCRKEILEQIASRKYDLYLLTYIDILWEDDPLREHSTEDERHYFYSQYRDIVINSGIPWADIRGNNEQRLKTALDAIRQINTDIPKNDKNAAKNTPG